eukprot:scaffold65607_cov26-Prasinocladus_malaysianus.AAC.1
MACGPVGKFGSYGVGCAGATPNCWAGCVVTLAEVEVAAEPKAIEVGVCEEAASNCCVSRRCQSARRAMVVEEKRSLTEFREGAPPRQH